MTRRRLIRPVEREKMRSWLERHLCANETLGVRWRSDIGDGVFEVDWKHASRHGYSIANDGLIFQKWALHTGKYHTGDEVNPAKWKSNFRCALHSLPDVKDVTEIYGEKGRKSTRVFRFLTTEKPSMKVKRNSNKRHQKFPMATEEEMNECDEGFGEISSTENSPIQCVEVCLQLPLSPRDDIFVGADYNGSENSKTLEPIPMILDDLPTATPKWIDSYSGQFEMTKHGCITSTTSHKQKHRSGGSLTVCETKIEKGNIPNLAVLGIISDIQSEPSVLGFSQKEDDLLNWSITNEEDVEDDITKIYDEGMLADAFD